jgi:hypothetical protein
MTLEFAKIGIPLKNTTLQVYLRYIYWNSYQGVNKTEYFPTGVYLSLPDMEKLLNDPPLLTGKIYFDLETERKAKKQIIDDFKDRTGHYPIKDHIVNQSKVIEKKTDTLVASFLAELKGNVSGTSYDTYLAQIEAIQLNFAQIQSENKRVYMDDPKIFSALETTKLLEQHLIKVETDNGYTKLLMQMFIRMQNFIRKKFGIELITKYIYPLSHLKKT